MADPSFRKPLPRLTRLSGPFWEGTKQGELRLQRCTACGHYELPPSPRCSQCLSADLEWVKASGRGKVWSWIRMWQRYFPAFEGEIPYNVAYVELEEGPRLMTNIVDCDAADLRCDLPVEVAFEDVTEDIALPKFRPVR